MRWMLAVATLLACAACKDRRSFDERYEDTGERIEEKARRLDNALANEATANAEAVPDGG